MSPLRETTATPPKATRALAAVLPSAWRALACGTIHTIPAGYLGDCQVCGRDWTGEGARNWLSVRGTRSPLRRGRPSETVLHVQLTPTIGLHRLQSCDGGHHWMLAWRRSGDVHHARVRPRIDFGHQNISARARVERSDRELYAAQEHDQAD